MARWSRWIIGYAPVGRPRGEVPRGTKDLQVCLARPGMPEMA